MAGLTRGGRPVEGRASGFTAPVVSREKRGSAKSPTTLMQLSAIGRSGGGGWADGLGGRARKPDFVQRPYIRVCGLAG